MKQPRMPGYHRQRFLLALLQAATARLSKKHLRELDVQRLLFFCKKKAGFDDYDFINFRNGPLSFQAESDLDLLKSYGWLENTAQGIQLKHQAYVLDNKQRAEKLRDLIEEYGKSSIDPSAHKSPRKKDVRKKGAGKKAAGEKRKTEREETMVYTIGYEGLTLERYLQKLIDHQVLLLCDVRHNPFSRKFGFSKTTLARVLDEIPIEYRSFHKLGIESQKRKELDRKQLLSDYRAVLPELQPELNRLLKAFEGKKKVALTCFEAESTDCHRHCIGEWLKSKDGFQVQHL